MLSLKAEYKRAKQEHLASPDDAGLKAYKAAKKAYKAASPPSETTAATEKRKAGTMIKLVVRGEH